MQTYRLRTQIGTYDIKASSQTSAVNQMFDLFGFVRILRVTIIGR